MLERVTHAQGESVYRIMPEPYVCIALSPLHKNYRVVQNTTASSYNYTTQHTAESKCYLICLRDHLLLYYKMAIILV